MESRVEERRTAQRHPVEAQVMIHRERGVSVPALAVDISSSGMFVRLDRPQCFRLGETVTIDVSLPADSEQAFSTWGSGTVVRLEGDRPAIQICAGIFDHGTT